MKKIFLLTVLLFSVLSASAQTNTVVSRHNLRQEISRVFFRAQQASNAAASPAVQADQKFASTPEVATSSLTSDDLIRKIQRAYISRKPSVRPEKQWQIALFLADTNRPLSETLGILRKKITEGTLRHAAVLDISPRAKKRQTQKENPAAAQEYPAVFYFLYMGQKKPITEKIYADSTVDAPDQLAPLFEHFQNTQDVYSAAIIDGHGSGFDMFYGENGWLDMEQILSSLQGAGLSLDVLNLASCHMGSLYNLHQLAQYKNVAYLVASSDIMTGNSERTYYTLLQHLNAAPRQAAINAAASARKVHHFDDSYSTNNVIALHLPGLFTPVQNWFNDYGRVMLAGSARLQKDMLQVFDPRWGTWRSLNKILRRQTEYLLNSQEKLEWNGYELPELKQNCIQSARILEEALRENTLTQWCYSEQLGRVYVDQIPPNIDCLDGVSVTKKQLEYLVETETPALEKQLEKQYRLSRLRFLM
ncbi:MAG: hypothetical protein Q4P84_06710 [Elusimicrobiales bacterium]|nr:hypothetical protein [Elusimicrobiales bacterium]